jgi:hypothetical protein
MRLLISHANRQISLLKCRFYKFLRVTCSLKYAQTSQCMIPAREWLQMWMWIWNQWSMAETTINFSTATTRIIKMSNQRIKTLKCMILLKVLTTLTIGSTLTEVIKEINMPIPIPIIPMPMILQLTLKMKQILLMQPMTLFQ